MTWENYRRLYFNYLIESGQIHIFTLISGYMLKDFPKKLPEELGKPLKIGLKEAHDNLEKFLTTKGRTKNTSRMLFSNKDEIQSKLISSTFFLIVAKMMADISQNADNKFQVSEVQSGFERLSNYQALIMVFAHLDAFMADTLRVICKVRPEILKRDKKIDWATVLEFGGKDDLVNYLIERYVYEFDWLSLPNRVQFFRNQIGLDINISKTSIDLLKSAEEIRHILVHNGGRVSQEYVNRTGCGDIMVGDIISVPFEYVERVIVAARGLAGDVFVSVSKKFFQIGEKRLQGVWRMGKNVSSKKGS